jgi:hypothetical protein
MLKASGYLAAFAVAAPASTLAPAAAEPEVPAVLHMLLAEYAAAAQASREAQERVSETRRAKSFALDKASLYFMFLDGNVARLGDYGSACDPKYALSWLDEERNMHVARARGDADAISTIRRRHKSAKRRLQRQAAKYYDIERQSGWIAACDVDSESYHRFTECRDALQAYRPTTLTEVAVLIEGIDKVGQYIGHSHGLTVRDLANMLRAGA